MVTVTRWRSAVTRPLVLARLLAMVAVCLVTASGQAAGAAGPQMTPRTDASTPIQWATPSTWMPMSPSCSSAITCGAWRSSLFEMGRSSSRAVREWPDRRGSR